jgi:hypothetical protein
MKYLIQSNMKTLIFYSILSTFPFYPYVSQLLTGTDTGTGTEDRQSGTGAVLCSLLSLLSFPSLPPPVLYLPAIFSPSMADTGRGRQNYMESFTSRVQLLLIKELVTTAHSKLTLILALFRVPLACAWMVIFH